MNKYCIRDFLHNKLLDYTTTFKTASLDTKNQEYLCQDHRTNPVYNFDDFVKDHYSQNGIIPSSPDAIYIGNKKLYFIEFKNQHPADIDNINMKTKFEHGTKILQELLKDFLPKDVEYVFCVVYKNSSKTNESFNSSWIEANSPRFGLDKKNEETGEFYDRIIVQDVNFYKQMFHNLQC